MTQGHDVDGSVSTGSPTDASRTLLLWDAPNMDMSLGSLLGTRPTSAFRPRFDAVGRWLLGLAGPDAAAEACVFTNVVPGNTEQVRPWVEALRNVGFAVFAKPKLSEDSDIDDDMLSHIALRRDEGGLAHVVVASGDGRAFREPLEQLVHDGVTVTVIGFREHAGFAQASDILSFLDLEDIDGVFREPLPRITLDTLPAEGAWLPPIRSLSSLLELPTVTTTVGRPVPVHAPIALPCDPSCSVLRDAVVDVDAEGRIGYCGPAATAPASDAPVRQVSGMLLPGLVNIHCHSPMTVLRGIGGDLPLLRWLHEVIWPAEAQLDESDVHAGMLLGCVELLRAGVTTSVEMYFFTDAVIDAILTAGSRAVITPGIIAAPGWDRLGTWEELRDDVSARIDANGVRFGPDERIELGYGPHAAYTLPAEALPAIAEHARVGALLHVHVAETAGEDALQRATYGSVPAMLERLGVLGGRVLAAHSVHLSAEDIALLARCGVAVAHCPGSNAKLAAGTAAVVELRAAGVAVGLGTDGPASSDDLDLWVQTRLAALLARLRTGNAAALTAAEVLLMATRGGAAAIGRDDLGALEPGRWADLVMVNLDDPAFVNPDDDAQLVSNLVWGGGARLVREVWVAGQLVVDRGEPTRVDRALVQADVRAVTARLHG